MAGRGGEAYLADNERFYRLCRLCQDGKLKELKKFVDGIDSKILAELLSNYPPGKKSVFGYTLLHNAVARGNPEVLSYLLERAKDTNVNCRANSGYTPLHLAASCGHGKCVKALLEHGADISCVDDYGKTPKQTAELSSKSSIVKLLKSEGEL